MFARLFAESGLSLDRLKSLLEVGAAGSIVKATAGDSVKQSQYSRQIKELEDFFRVKLIERHGKGTRLTPSGKELARISRFFLLGLSNFQRGCLAEEQTFRIGAGATFIREHLLPVLSQPEALLRSRRFVTEVATDDEIERRLHDLTLDFGVVTTAAISRPLQLKELGCCRLILWVPKALHEKRASAERALRKRELSLILASKEVSLAGIGILRDYPSRLACDDFLQAQAGLAKGAVAAVLPDYLAPAGKSFLDVRMAGRELGSFCYQLVWNPRLLRLNPHAIRTRDLLARALAERFQR